MPEKNKKLRLYKFASEYNLATETLMEFLQDKGHDVKSHMSLLSDEMLADIQAKYKKDMDKAESHYRKVNEFHKKRIEKSQDQGPDEITDETDTPADSDVVVKEIVETTNEVIEVAEEVQAAPEPEAIKEPEITEQTVIEDEKVEKIVALEKPEEIVEAIPEEPVPVAEDDSVFRTQTEIDLENGNRGLTILGKIDLEDKSGKRHKQDHKKNGKEGGDKPEAKKEGREISKSSSHKPKAILAKDDIKDTDAENLKKKKWKKKKTQAGQEVTESLEDKLKGKKKKKKKGKRPEVDQDAVAEAIKKTMLGIDSTPTSIDRASARKKKRREKAELEEIRLEQEMLEDEKLKVTEFIAVGELANLMDVPVSEVIQKCLGLGLMVSINQRLDTETITIVADEFGYEVEFQEEYISDALEDADEDDAESLKSRPPVVTIMGHVDHGKTSLLDQIRRANVVAGEAGGITQHIGAYKVDIDGKQITFLDTPGHEAFTAMRARGASVTDIVVLIVAADDAVMPQTIEGINHALAAGVPIIVAINKIDKPNSNIEKIKQQLAERNVLVEDWGGKYQCCEISAKMGINIDVVLEKILLEAEMLDLKANPDRRARGAVIESQLDKGRGITATVLIQKGTMRIGDPFVAGVYHGRVRAMFDERNNKITEAGPSTPVLVLGFEGAPQAGDGFVIVESEREAREISSKRLQLKREQDFRQHSLITLDEIASRAGKGELKELPLIVKGDVDGSVEALADSLMKLTNDEVTVKVIHRGVGAISESDVILAAASNAIIVGFHVRPHTNARKLAEKEKVDIRLYNVIYDTINEVKSALEGMLDPVLSEKLVATVEIRDTFKVPKAGTIAGCYVTDGKITRNQKIRLFRDGVVTYEGTLSSLKRFKEDVKEVDAGYECGLGIHNFNDLKVGDIVEAYEIIEEKKKLKI